MGYASAMASVLFVMMLVSHRLVTKLLQGVGH